MSEWIKWEGGECPVSAKTRVDFMLRDGEVFCDEEARSCYWEDTGGPRDIVAYRLSNQEEKPESALSVQRGGDHYKKLKIQPVEYIHANGLGFCQGNVIKYVTRYKDKGGISDLEKAKHFIDLLIEFERG